MLQLDLIDKLDNMVRIPTLALLGALAFNVCTVYGAVGAEHAPSKRAAGLRLIKTSDEDPGTWMTEEEKFEKFMSKRLGFVDITDTMVQHHLLTLPTPFSFLPWQC